jgi:plasmid maintenance system antidote protein VapI
MALRIEKAFGVKMDTLMRMQSAYDIARARKDEKKIHVRRVRVNHALPQPALRSRHLNRGREPEQGH